MGTADQRPGWHHPLPWSPVGPGSPLLSAKGPVASSADLGGGMGGQVGREELGLNRRSPPHPLGLQSQNMFPSRVSECFWPLPMLGKHGMGGVSSCTESTQGPWCPPLPLVPRHPACGCFRSSPQDAPFPAFPSVVPLLFLLLPLGRI